MSGSPWKRVAWQKNMATLAKIPLVDAIEQAENLDRQLKETGEFAGPMHGVPVSLKDQFHVKYAETTIGYVSWVGTFEGAQGTGREFHDQSQLVEELHSLGAVLYCKVIEWEPPSHEEALALHDIILDIDGGDDVWRQLNILHEPVIPQVSERFGNGPKDPVPTLELLDIVLKHKAYVARYLEYWASTVKHTGTGRAVDAVILPVAPHAAVIPGDAVLPVTKADKNVDVAHGDFKPLTPKDEVNWRAYTYDGAPVCVQLMGRKFEEERILGIAMRVEELFRKLTKWVVSALIVDN
ncbi:general amidase GmdA [Metarhizium robertsii ARSEF 23]|uniref:General amidase GmdA n=1 Tax=Metarhizium robertsii (strain ARSEF 23 / ATCC MYA-3075) TaxID=655844 RepID=E9FDF4_METRA|nr:general amidase GmdA [Metarhizium robertsii ARSEF 23]EFY94235.2 general amidase GmdA [Metarhizium robertsii ARSEF 23]